MFVYIIAVAAGIGSLVGAFFRLRLTALLWSMPLLCFLYGVCVLLAPYIKENEAAPELLRAIMLELSDLSLFIPMLIAGAAGAVFASSLTRYVQTESPAVPDRIHQINRRQKDVPHDTLKDRTQQMAKTRVDLAGRAATPLPVFEVTPEYSPPPPTAPAERGADQAAGPVSPPVDNRRGQGRRRSALAGDLVFSDGAAARCTIQDLSVGGARVRLMGPWPDAEVVGLRDLTHGIGHDVTLRWKAGPIAGLRFTASRQL